MNKLWTHNDFIPYITSSLTAIIGSLVLWGWFTNNIDMIQVYTHSVNMQYNTALCFVAASTAIFALCKQYRVLTFLLGGFVLTIAFLTTLEYVFDTNINIDALFMPNVLNHQQGLSYRMSPNGALILGLTGISILTLGNLAHVKIGLRRLLFLLMIINIISISISFIALFGYIVDLPGTNGWGSYTKMAMATAIGNILLCVGIIVIIHKKSHENNISFAKWTPWFVFVVLEVITLSFWQAASAFVEKNEIQQNKIAAQSVRSLIKDELEYRKQSLMRMASRWSMRKGGTPHDEWSQDALNTMADQQGYQSIEWVDPKLYVRWIVPLQGNEAALNYNLLEDKSRSKDLLHSIKTGQTTITHILNLKSGHKGFLIYVPIGKGEKLQGILVGAINAKLFFDEIFNDAITDYNVAIYQDKELIYQRNLFQKPYEKHNSITYVIKSNNWSITSWPQPELVAKQHSWLPSVILLVGFLIAGMLSLITYLAQIALKNAHKAREEIKTRQKTEEQLIVYSKKLKKLSLIDPLTGVDNRRSLTTLLQNELNFMKKNDTPLSIILIDVDHFKQINDTYGHVTGDNVLHKVGSILRKNIRTSDLVARYGGEEFCVVLRNTTDRQAYTVAEKLRCLIGEQVFLCEKKKPFQVTCSFGVYQVSSKLKKITQVFEIVDGALYTAKNSGRNCVVLV